MRNLSNHGLALLVTCGSIVFAAGACAQGAHRKEPVNLDAAARDRREQERLTEKHRQMHAAIRGRGFGIHVSHPPARLDLPHQQERLQ